MMQADGLILAGGKSTRMGGRHKGDLFFQEQTFLERIIEELKKVVSTVWISYGDLIRREYPGCEIVQDEYPERGPIGGLHAGFKKSRSELIFTAPAICPFCGRGYIIFSVSGWSRLKRRGGSPMKGPCRSRMGGPTR